MSRPKKPLKDQNHKHNPYNDHHHPPRVLGPNGNKNKGGLFNHGNMHRRMEIRGNNKKGLS